MNRYGSYRALLANSLSAVAGSIDVYNRPSLDYRDQAAVILLVNGRELLFKAIFSKNRVPIFYPKEQGKPYQSLSIWDAFNRTAKYFPIWVPHQAVGKNLEVLVKFRNAATHLYTQRGLAHAINMLTQTSVVNYRELVLYLFDLDIARRMNLVLQPLGFGPDLDPMTYLKQSLVKTRSSRVVAEITATINNAIRDLESEGVDISCFMSVYKIRFESVKKLENADLVVGVAATPDESAGYVVQRSFDPNDPNWLRQKEILEILKDIHGIFVSQYVFQALVWKYQIKTNPKYCWVADEGVLTKYSREIIAMFRRLDRGSVEQALDDYRNYQRSRPKARR